MNDENPSATLPSLRELFGVGAAIGTCNYALSVMHDFHAAGSFNTIVDSANIGLIATAGVLVFGVYRNLRCKPL